MELTKLTWHNKRKLTTGQKSSVIDELLLQFSIFKFLTKEWFSNSIFLKSSSILKLYKCSIDLNSKYYLFWLDDGSNGLYNIGVALTLGLGGSNESPELAKKNINIYIYI